MKWINELLVVAYIVSVEAAVLTLVISATQLAGGLLLKKVKYFEVMLNIFAFSRV